VEGTGRKTDLAEVRWERCWFLYLVVRTSHPLKRKLSARGRTRDSIAIYLFESTTSTISQVWFLDVSFKNIVDARLNYLTFDRTPSVPTRRTYAGPSNAKLLPDERQVLDTIRASLMTQTYLSFSNVGLLF
jgi:hypothetical protein